MSTALHHGTHRHLLTDVPTTAVTPAELDAIVIPTSRPAHWLREAMGLAGRLGCGAVVMCSGAVKAVEASALGDRVGIPVIAIDIDDAEQALPTFSADDLLDSTILQRTSDTSVKRNLALMLARIAGWDRILFLDDDIYGIGTEDARAAAGLLDDFDVVGMHNLGYPDNSVVCHAYREVGAAQDQFIGAGALVVSPTRCRSFFPHIYNSDWFFMLGYGSRRKFAVTGEMRQKEFDPFANPDRARSEEFGDCLAEGIFWLLDQNLPTARADRGHWGMFLNHRISFIESVIQELSMRIDSRAGRRRLSSLQVARATSTVITPGLCADYVNRWRTDLAAWRQFVRELPIGLGIDKALQHLSWSIETSAHPWPEFKRCVPFDDHLFDDNGGPRWHVCVNSKC